MKVNVHPLPYTRATMFHRETTPQVVFDLRGKNVTLNIDGDRSFVKFCNSALAFPRRTLHMLEKKYDR